MSKEEQLEELGLDFGDDESARESMKEYIRENFSDVLGDKIELLEAPNGLELIQQEVRSLIREEGLSERPQSQVA